MLNRFCCRAALLNPDVSVQVLSRPCHGGLKCLSRSHSQNWSGLLDELGNIFKNLKELQLSLAQALQSTQLFFRVFLGTIFKESVHILIQSAKNLHHFTLKGQNFASIPLIRERNSCSFSTQGALCENTIKEGDNLQLRLNERFSFRCYFFIFSL